MIGGKHPLQGIQQLDYAMDEAPFRLFIAGQGMLYGGRGPDNPATEKLDWLVWCSPATKARLMVVHDLWIRCIHCRRSNMRSRVISCHRYCAVSKACNVCACHWPKRPRWRYNWTA